MIDLSNKVALVTGGTSGIGKACAYRLVKQGAAVLITGRSIEKGNAILKDAEKNNLKIDFIQADISSEADCQRVKDFILGKYGKLDILYNNAGIFPVAQPQPVLQSRQDWENIFNVNMFGMVTLTELLLPILLENKGKIINNASIAGLHYLTPGKSYAYAASKSAVIQFTRMLAKNYAEKLRVNCICPGTIDTPIFVSLNVQTKAEKIPVRRVGLAQDVANLVAFLASSDADYINGAVIPIDGGETL